MVEVVGIRFKANGKIYYFNPKGDKYEPGDKVLVETSREIEYGEIVLANRLVSQEDIVSPLKDIVRLASEEDSKKNEENKIKALEAFKTCKERVVAHGLEMKLIDCEYTFDNNKLLFYFTADGRIDFRDLVKDLASIFKTRIELRQIGVRDEARTIGGLGLCGRELCCSCCISDFQPVSIKMAKEQGLSLSPNKISGTCGRLMCCLNYEQEAYESAIKRMPRPGSVVETADGMGLILSTNLLKETIQVRLDKENETELTSYRLDDVRVLKNASADDLENDFSEDLKELEKD